MTDPFAELGGGPEILAIKILRYIVQEQGAEVGGEAIAMDVSETLQALSFAAALILEMDPKAKTPAELRGLSEIIRKEVHKKLILLRGITNERGIHPLEALGGSMPGPERGRQN